ncbi:GlxA family transcriptional regulator [Streptomyces rochei]|uniref:Helix-turn-helix domain-containing protein n=1 Tax=Streptomyces vinaceusdrappus TaxID=67376 RepID=A0ABY6C4U5_9ACTN|nr:MULTISPECIES: helix-turn-helix domain-containing protein [Streptomyces]NUV96907.1 helix-turn-helix domain-containing protein [Streptomyces sp. KAI 90]RSS23541.1 helix-turn-helix domain-containing protein [Streptomyces sp. WAC08452]UXI82825.1 helix-turn-helix domain-containing protein [Streptomyces vinaceusdrappus]
MAVSDEPLHRVVVLVRPGLLPMELGIVHRLFGTAVDDTGRPLYSVVTCAAEPGEISTDADFTVNVPAGPEALRNADTVVVPAAVEDYGPQQRGRLSPPVRAALAQVPATARLASICTGSFVLAAAGLLAGRRATTHWKSCPELSALYPEIDVDPDVLYTDDRRVLTSAGVAAGIDLCLHMIRSDHGADVANTVARGTVVPPHREGGQAQYIDRPVPEPADDSVAAARVWALEHLGETVTLEDLARRAATSVRTLTRKFRQETGMPPMQWLGQQRLQYARRLLERTDEPVDRIAAAAGFGTGTAMRQHFREALGVSPRAYRNTFRGAG